MTPSSPARPAGTRARPRRSAALERAAVWVLTGSLGRLAAFLAELAIAWWAWAVRGRRGWRDQ